MLLCCCIDAFPAETNIFSFRLELLTLDHNKLTGDVDLICESDFMNISYFISDCGDYDGTISCECCTACCKDVANEKGCNAGDLLANHRLNFREFQTVREYNREQFVFNENIVFKKKPSGNDDNGNDDN